MILLLLSLCGSIQSVHGSQWYFIASRVRQQMFENPWIRSSCAWGRRCVISNRHCENYELSELDELWYSGNESQGVRPRTANPAEWSTPLSYNVSSQLGRLGLVGVDCLVRDRLGGEVCLWCVVINSMPHYCRVCTVEEEMVGYSVFGKQLAVCYYFETVCKERVRQITHLAQVDN